MNINLHIDSIVLDGIELAAGNEAHLHQSVINQLTTMLMQQGIGSGPGNAAGTNSSHAASIHVARNANPERFGMQLAHSIYGGISHSAAFNAPAQGGPP